ncbi:MAG: hypothetical protein HZA19_05045 [Nitrospirae bacterium]|nr:hypothetical protein [Nitrospirota bacterium]
MTIERRRKQNERKFGSWRNLPSGGRRYQYEVKGRRGGRAIYIKETDESENTVKFWQEIYDLEGKLVEIHEKFPVDRGHRPVEEKGKEG